MRQALTAVQVYRQDIEPTLKHRQAFVKKELAAFYDAHQCWPTGLELLRFVTARHLDGLFDVNSVRPRLHELWQQGWLSRDEKRTCRVSGKKVMVWKLIERPAKQMDIFR